jgi:hypothetical protein
MNHHAVIFVNTLIERGLVIRGINRILANFDNGWSFISLSYNYSRLGHYFGIRLLSRKLGCWLLQDNILQHRDET